MLPLDINRLIPQPEPKILNLDIGDGLLQWSGVLGLWVAESHCSLARYDPNEEVA